MTDNTCIKIAVITDDGKTISQHFGRAQSYFVATVENGQITQRELRSKLSHAHLVHLHTNDEKHEQGHGMDAASHNKHLQMSDAIADCQVLLCRGMGMGAYESMKMRHIQPVVTDIADIDKAIMAYLEGSIIDRTDRLH